MFLLYKKYLREERQKVKKAGFGDKDLRLLCGVSLKGGGLLSHYWGKSQWILPTEKHYTSLQETGFFQKPYEELRQEYERLRQEYEELRYTFNNQGLPSVLQHEPVKQNGHITPKPVDILEKIIKTSSNEGDIILDCFMGSGSTGVACMNTNRRFIGIELDSNYFNIAKERIEEAYK